jgi:hypothetical protein
MIDIETFGIKQTAPIVSIAAVQFNVANPEIQPQVFYTKVDIDSCLDIGCKIESKTIIWWMQQPKEALQEITNHEGLPIKKALLELSNFIKNFGEDICVWGNSARFDLGILQNKFDYFKIEIPWNFKNELDLRTIVSFNPDIKKKTSFKGTRHNPVDDCIHQISYLNKTIEWIKNEF